MESLPLWLNGLLFLPAAAAIWWAGVRLERYADLIAHRTRLGQAFTGMLLLAAATSLPEVATTITAVAVLDNPTLAVHNLLGGVALQTALLVAADVAMKRGGALTFFSPRIVLTIQGVGLVLLLQLTIAGISVRGRPTVLSISLWLVLLVLAYLALLYLTHRHRGQPRWTPSRTDDLPAELIPGSGAEEDSNEKKKNKEEEEEEEADPGQRDRPSLGSVWLRFAGASLLVLVGGWFAAQSADVLARQTGLGPAFLGATLLALATSLPELSTTLAAARNGRYPLAISNIFGSNAFDVVLLFLADALYRGGTILAYARGTEVFVATIGTAMTCLYLWGLLERDNRTVLRIGWDSAAAVILYVVGMAVLYFLR